MGGSWPEVTQLGLPGRTAENVGYLYPWRPGSGWGGAVRGGLTVAGEAQSVAACEWLGRHSPWPYLGMTEGTRACQGIKVFVAHVSWVSFSFGKSPRSPLRTGSGTAAVSSLQLKILRASVPLCRLCPRRHGYPLLS